MYAGALSSISQRLARGQLLNDVERGGGTAGGGGGVERKNDSLPNVKNKNKN